MERHRDNIGVLRLLFASLVIIGHAPEMIDGDRRREPLTILFHSVSLGELSVDAFFLISGYLITMSWLRSDSMSRYLERRALRIYPAFIVAFLLSVFVLAPAVGGAPWGQLRTTILNLVTLRPPPDYSGQLKGLHYPALNGAMWTIAYEFRAYLLVALFGSLGILQQRRLMLLITIACLLSMTAGTVQAVRAALDSLATHHQRAFEIIGAPWFNLRLNSAFLVGGCVYLWREQVLPRLNARTALAAGLTTAILLFRDPHFAEPALITVGAAGLFWIAFKADLGFLQRVNDRWDISYGVYLYGWPIATAIRWFDRGVSPWMLAAATLPLAAAAGAASWWGLEKWTKDLARSNCPPSAGPPMSRPPSPRHRLSPGRGDLIGAPVESDRDHGGGRSRSRLVAERSRCGHAHPLWKARSRPTLGRRWSPSSGWWSARII